MKTIERLFIYSLLAALCVMQYGHIKTFSRFKECISTQTYERAHSDKMLAEGMLENSDRLDDLEDCVNTVWSHHRALFDTCKQLYVEDHKND